MKRDVIENNSISLKKRINRRFSTHNSKKNIDMGKKSPFFLFQKKINNIFAFG